MACSPSGRLGAVGSDRNACAGFLGVLCAVALLRQLGENFERRWAAAQVPLGSFRGYPLNHRAGRVALLPLWHREERQMALKPPFTVRVEKPETALAETMNDMRSWLDKHQVRPIEFKIARTGFPGVAFDIQFRSADEAFLFEQMFCLKASDRNRWRDRHLARPRSATGAIAVGKGSGDNRLASLGKGIPPGLPQTRS
jgi:hypothetical protein